MGIIKAPRAVKLFVGLLSGDRDLMRRTTQLLAKPFGPIDLESDYWPFTHTDYYLAELGDEVDRHFVSFERLIYPDQIAGIKQQTNEIELRAGQEMGASAGSRPVNLDPGYVSLGKMVLATTKDYAHRIYLQQGIYAEVTLHFHDGRWRPWPWTYADYASGMYEEFFLTVREKLKEQFRVEGPRC